ncbi:hypothetical protein HANVADRAFT_8128 [Hanseniaspora valbyensis NRRL Y-1626]|uniref:Uncharacterized protein n=1 Tax=Hanseniaspora valbyensis NRRL Y-1626 TaxID=766949 RepID=A0A1B7T965_9ASCO|nr:hypothetical protein HANVADRAFT_8128 [Hanseniaspora valbyensis NRRL Y-1626]
MKYIEDIVDVKEYLFEVLKSEHIKNIDTIENLNEYKVINYNINFTEESKTNDFKYINYIPIQLFNPNTNELLTVLQQSVSKNSFKIRKSQTLIEFNNNLEEYLHTYKGPERDAIMKYTAIDFTKVDDVNINGNYNIPNNISLHSYLTKLSDEDQLNEKLDEIDQKDILSINKIEDILLKNLISKVIFNKNYRSKLIRQIEYYYYYKDYETAKKLASNVVVIYEWFINVQNSTENKFKKLTINETKEEEIEEEEDNDDNFDKEKIKKGLEREIIIVKKIIEKCNQKCIEK